MEILVIVLMFLFLMLAFSMVWGMWRITRRIYRYCTRVRGY